jgi:hypothetical protein
MPLMGTSMPLMFLSAWHQQLGLFTPCFLAWLHLFLVRLPFVSIPRSRCSH